ncbi:MAG: hypothetical protein DME98_00285 [Verrucomicrobia bacterium]|nr:MAG: hypothetical protein DME98_00285 [Verrucomicrobiota bacterium]
MYEYLRLRIDEQLIDAVQVEANLARQKNNDQPDALAHELRARPASKMPRGYQYTQGEERCDGIQPNLRHAAVL